MLTGHDVATGLGSLLLAGIKTSELARTYSSIVTDSREAAEADLFVALPGEVTDGHRFIEDALRRGATGVLARSWPEAIPQELRQRAALFQVSDPLAALQALAAAWRSRFPVKVIGITGSVGKTSTKDALATVLARGFCVLKSRGNRNTEIGLPLTLLELRQEHQRAVLELGMNHLGDIALLCDLARPEIGVVTNIGPTHLEHLGTLERITDAKAELVVSLPPEGVAVLNGDDPRVAALAKRTTAKVVTYGLRSEAECRAEELEVRGLEGITFSLCWHGHRQQARTPLLGHHNVYTALAAATVGLVEGLSLEQVAVGLGTLAESNRIHVRKTLGGAVVLDDTYNASPASTKAALELLATMPGKKIAVLADMLELGAYEEAGHREVGHHAATVVDRLYTVGTRAGAIAMAARQAGLSATEHFTSKEEAAHALDGLLKEGVFLLVKGSRGMAMEDLVNRLCPV